jgi:hypothetical protein
MNLALSPDAYRILLSSAGGGCVMKVTLELDRAARGKPGNVTATAR